MCLLARRATTIMRCTSLENINSKTNSLLEISSIVLISCLISLVFMPCGEVRPGVTLVSFCLASRSALSLSMAFFSEMAFSSASNCSTQTKQVWLISWLRSVKRFVQLRGRFPVVVKSEVTRAQTWSNFLCFFSSALTAALSFSKLSCTSSTCLKK